MCHQSGGLVQREIEASGISTITLSNNPGGTERVRPPRWVRVRFPRGATLGEPGRAGRQLDVLRDVLRALLEILEPGGHVELPYRWEAEPILWRDKPLRDGAYS